jgi:hypothetical protein
MEDGKLPPLRVTNHRVYGKETAGIDREVSLVIIAPISMLPMVLLAIESVTVQVSLATKAAPVRQENAADLP